MRISVPCLTTLACTLVCLSSCTGRPGSASAHAGASLALDAPLPRDVPPGTTLAVGDPSVQRVIEANGWEKDLPFTIQWAQISGGPATTEAFHAGALDIGSCADVPPIHADWVGIPVKIIAVQLRRDPVNHPLYVLGVAPHAAVRTLADLRGKRIAYSPGQVQGEVVLRTLREQGLKTSDVTLVELPSTGDLYVNELAAGSVDVAPIAAGALSKRYLDRYASEGAKVLHHGAFRDDLTVLYAREETLRDPAKAAAIRAYVALWVRANQWIEGHHDAWIKLYWMRDQRLSPEDARYQVASFGERYTPSDWSTALDIERGAIEVLSPGTGHKPFDAATLFDPRFEGVIASALKAAGAADSRAATPSPAT